MSRLRKLRNAEGQRRSARISALEAEAQGHLMKDSNQGPAYWTRGKKNTKLRPLQQLKSSQNQGMKHYPHQHILKKSSGGDLSSSTCLPDKRILQLVLDTLQRRDTYEIFAEPVDPNEVEDYYAIIKEPMDFGTMRAKLHEGMYESLEQFERDIFLIFENAMHFNSSGTIYFRQARVINEIAKKVFDLLKNNPEKFELEFSEIRRNVGRKSQGDFRESTNIKSIDIAIGAAPKIVTCSSQGTTNRKYFKENHGCHNIAKHAEAKDVEIPTGTKNSSRCLTFEVDKRCTYKPLSLDENEFSTVYDKLKILEHVNQQDIGYKDSLKLFVKKLGPTAQNVAKRKLLGCEIHTASISAPCKPNTCNMFSASTPMYEYPLDQFHDYPKELKSPMKNIVNEKEKVEGTFNAERENGYSPYLGYDKIFSNQSFCFGANYSRTCVGDLNCFNQGSKETGKSRKMLLDESKLVNQEQLPMSIRRNAQSNNVIESRLENNCKF